MEIYSTMASVFTVVSFFVFVGIVFWAYSARRRRSFEEAANEPFALPDDVAPRTASRDSAARAASSGPSGPAGGIRVAGAGRDAARGAPR
jgi:cytochrome c oxidase cbb3-type subunit 4